LAAAAQQGWADRVLLGPAGPGQLAENLLATEIVLDPADLTSLAGIAQDPVDYWRHRSELPWR
jgi:aryl-alcohol dehydrogenase-like predicted oxidoreductase